MAIRVEFFGIARQRAGIEELEIPIERDSISLQEMLQAVTARLPQLEALIIAGRLHSSLVANLDGQQFLADPDTLIHDGQSLLLLSADAGG